jgi:hypothetical protein
MKNVIIIAALMIGLASCEKKLTYNTADIPAFAPLAKPDTGYQIHIPPFPVPANFEREIFIRVPIGNKEKIYITGYETKMRPGTHHVIAYKIDENNKGYNPPIGVIRDQNLANGKINYLSNLNAGNFILEATSPNYFLEMPEGYALPMEANQTLDMNSHYFNKTSSTLFGEVYFNLKTIPKSQVKHELKEFILQPDELIIPANKTTVITSIHEMEEKTNFIMMTSHYHKRGKKFEMYGVGGLNDGKLLYSSSDYVHPVINYHGTDPVVLQKGDKIKIIATYENETNREINFGVTSEDEMCIAYFYVTNE